MTREMPKIDVEEALRDPKAFSPNHRTLSPILSYRESISWRYYADGSRTLFACRPLNQRAWVAARRA
jgi:hypothetical protein